MTALSDQILSAATEALAKRRDTALPEDGLAHPLREDARAVVVAVLAALGGEKGKPGILPLHHGVSQSLLAMADELEAAGD